MNLEFEWDKNKNLANIAKHGVDFNKAKELFTLPNEIIQSDKNQEKRFILIAKQEADIFISIIFTLRSRKIRIISAITSKKKEIKLYQAKFNL